MTEEETNMVEAEELLEQATENTWSILYSIFKSEHSVDKSSSK